MALITSYLEKAIDKKSRKDTIKKVIKIIKEQKIEFDAIAFTGYSGSLIAPIIANRLNKDIILVRKSGDNCHSSHKIEGRTDKKSYIIIDDVISTGTTIKKIVNRMKDSNAFSHYKLNGVIFYSYSKYSPDKYLEKELNCKLYG